MNDWRDNYSFEPSVGPKKTMPPPGFTPSAFDDISNGVKRQSKGINFELIKFQKDQLYTLAKSPFKSIITNIIMLYMSPNGLSIITIGMVLMLFTNTFKDLYSMGSKFKSDNINKYDLNLMKLVYTIGCLGNIAVAIWKLNSMGLLPTNKSDWIHWESPLQSNQISI